MHGREGRHLLLQILKAISSKTAAKNKHENTNLLLSPQSHQREARTNRNDDPELIGFEIKMKMQRASSRNGAAWFPNYRMHCSWRSPLTPTSPGTAQPSQFCCWETSIGAWCPFFILSYLLCMSLFAENSFQSIQRNVIRRYNLGKLLHIVLFPVNSTLSLGTLTLYSSPGINKMKGK